METSHTLASPEPTIDRALIEQDLRQWADFLGPLIETRLEGLRGFRIRFLALTIPIGEILYGRLPASPAQMTYDALSRVLDLPDDELGALIDLAGLELGAWRGFPGSAPGDQVALAAAGVDRLAGGSPER